jgi:signal transduction histidine kinase
VQSLGFRDKQGANELFVKDNGLGIAAPYHQKVFGLFERLNPDAEGTGIGLALVRRIIVGHGGEAWVEPDGVGNGTTLCFVLPAGPEPV